MILVGLNCEWMNCAGAKDERKYIFQADDYHEAARETWKSSWASPWQNQIVLGGEFHDTENKRTWSIDGCGHSKKDYRVESDEEFRKRWKSG